MTEVTIHLPSWLVWVVGAFGSSTLSVLVLLFVRGIRITDALDRLQQDVSDFAKMTTSYHETVPKLVHEVAEVKDLAQRLHFEKNQHRTRIEWIGFHVGLLLRKAGVEPVAITNFDPDKPLV